jgi:energy-coupling factor transporter ATP-binding protein EcfA2
VSSRAAVGISGPGARRGGPLRAIELATAAVLGAMTVVLVIAGWFLPHASAITAFGVVPMAVVAYRHRLRAVAASTVSAATVGFLVAGTGPIAGVVLCGIVGGIAGHAHRRRWSAARVTGAAALVGPLLAAYSVGLLWVFASLRRLTLDQLRNVWLGLAGVAGKVVVLRPALRAADHAVDAGVRDWWQSVAVLVVVFVAASTLATWRYCGPLLRRLDGVLATDRLDGPLLDGERLDELRSDAVRPPGGVAPVPVVLDEVHVRYQGAAGEALAGVTLRVEAAERTVVVGPNGSGKSTLARLLAGREPTAGRVGRNGAAGLGRPGGTAIVAQRPESQVLGVRVGDDVVWGLPRDWPVDLEQVLGEVGLGGMATRDTSTLSGGELQRLAVAAALARRPGLLISDEATAMVDVDGRRALVDLLARLPRQRGVAVVAVTHRLAEAAGADRVVRLEAGRVVRLEAGPADGQPAPPLPLVPPPAPAGGGSRPPPGSSRPAVLTVDRVGHVYAEATPWAQVALRDVSLTVAEGDGVLVVGDNGSGKSTLAWVMAGLLRPGRGECRLDGEPVTGRVGAVALAFQHARLQVQRSKVGRDVCAAGGVEPDEAKAALALVGLDADDLWERSVDELSGGQLRRVALAGLLAGRPRVLVLDEPLAGLDEASRAGLLSTLGNLRRDRDLTLVVISHDLEGVDEVCDRVVRMDGGRIVEEAPPARAGMWPGRPGALAEEPGR